METDKPRRRTTKTELKQAVDAFFYRYESLTGGTREETIRQAPAGYRGLSEMAVNITKLASYPNKAALEDNHLMDRALIHVPARLKSYAQHLPEPDPTKIVSFYETTTPTES